MKIVRLTEEQLEFLQDQVSELQIEADDDDQQDLQKAMGDLLEALDNAEDA